jgi:hypothetical protein
LGDYYDSGIILFKLIGSDLIKFYLIIWSLIFETIGGNKFSLEPFWLFTSTELLNYSKASLFFWITGVTRLA